MRQFSHLKKLFLLYFLAFTYLCKYQMTLKGINNKKM